MQGSLHPATILQLLKAQAVTATVHGYCPGSAPAPTSTLVTAAQTPPPPFVLYGSYVFCRQRQDESLRRGGEQASVVVLSELPISNILLPLSQAAGQAYFSGGPTALEEVSGPVQQQQSYTYAAVTGQRQHTLQH